MPDNKDFLEQFSDAGKPASFKEEERIPVVKQKKPLNVKALIIAAVILLVLAIGAYFLFFAPKIEMPNFVGQSKNDVAAWVKQQGIEASGIVFSDEYNFDNSEGTILTQSIPAGKKVKNNVKLNFTLSLGPDPEEKISVPDLQSMEKEDIQDWISKNKLLKTKISTAYNDNVAENNVIDYSFSGCEEDTFTRGCTLKINVSKGSAPAGQVTVEDFVKKSYEAAEAWAKSKKVNIEKVEQYSDKVDSGLVISQSIASGKTMKEGETLVVYVSLGKAVTVPNMINWKIKEVETWCRKNNISLDQSEKDYATTTGLCIKQSLAAGSIAKEGDELVVIVSKGNPDMKDFTGSTLEELRDWVSQINIESANVTLNEPTYEFHDTIPVGEIISLSSKVYTNGSIDVVISKGKNVLLNAYTAEDSTTYNWNKLATGSGYTEEIARKMCEAYKVTYEVEYVNDETITTNGEVVSATRSDGVALADNTYCPQSVVITIKVNDESR